MGEESMLILNIYGALLTTKLSSRTSFFGFHFLLLVGQVGDTPAYAHQAAQKVKLGDAPSCFYLGFIYIGPW